MVAGCEYVNLCAVENETPESAQLDKRESLVIKNQIARRTHERNIRVCRYTNTN